MELAAIVADLARWEGRMDYLYLDSRGFVTVGVGNLVATPEVCCRLPFVVPHMANAMRASGFGMPASDDTKRAAWAAIHAAPRGHRETFYASLTSIRLPEADIDAIAQSRLATDFLPGLQRLYPHFDDIPASAQSALTDMIYNLGEKGLSKFTHLAAAVRQRDWRLASLACHVSTCRKERNDWRAEMLAKAGG